MVWPAGIDHGAWTDGSEMRAIVVELDDTPPPTLVLDGAARTVADGPVLVTPADGALSERPLRRDDHDEAEGEPW